MNVKYDKGHPELLSIKQDKEKTFHFQNYGNWEQWCLQNAKYKINTL